MTPAQLEHLKLIDAYCEHKLAAVEYIPHYSEGAEAGWRATRAVIKRFHDSAICREWHGYMQTAVEPILAAFPLELIQKP